MARPTTKDSLVEMATENYHQLYQLINGLSLEQQEAIFSFDDRDRNIRDVLIHLHEWHGLMEEWYAVGMKGEKPAMPKKGYTWKTTADMNQEFRKDHQCTSLEDAKRMLQASHTTMMGLIERHFDEELFTKKYYPWTNTTSLGAYLVSATSSHYDWALKKIRKHKKALPN